MRILLVLGVIACTAAAVAGVGRTLHTLMTRPTVRMSPPAAGQLAELEITAVPARQTYIPPVIAEQTAEAQRGQASGVSAPTTGTAQQPPAFPAVTTSRAYRVHPVRPIEIEESPDPRDDTMSPERKDLFEEALATLSRQYNLKVEPNSRDLLSIQAALEQLYIGAGRMPPRQFDQFLMNARVVLNRNPAKFIRIFQNANPHDILVLPRRVAAAAASELDAAVVSADPRIRAEFRRDAARDNIRESLRAAFKIEPRNELAVTRDLVAKHGFSQDQVTKGMLIAERSPEKFSAFLNGIPPQKDPRQYAKQVQEFVDQTEVDRE